MENITTKKVKQKVKNGIFRTLFSRSFIFAALIILQLFGYFILLSSVIASGSVKYAILVIVSIIVGFIIINRNDNPMNIITWLFLILGFPVFGIFIYMFITIQTHARKLSKKFNEEFARTKNSLIQNKEILDKLKEENKQISNLATYLHNTSGSIIDNKTDLTYFPSSESKFESLKEDLRKAKDFIFMEYFIIDKGRMWGEILDILKQKVKEGVEVRLMYDGTCSYKRLPVKYPQELGTYGIKCKVFYPIRPILTTYQNNRDHRKIAVIDGKIGYTGGVNLADEYINEINIYGQWKDAAVKLYGNAVKNFTLMFLQVWNMQEKEKEDYSKYLDIQVEGIEDGYITGYGDTPYDNDRIGENVYLSMIDNAKDYIHIVTPYLIPSYEMTRSLIFAAKRGVDVKIIMPNNPDKKYAFWLARTIYRNLIENGVKIYEWKPGFIHSKIFVVDGEQATVGSINIDFRSLFLHLECSSYIYKNSQIKAIEQDYQETLKDCFEIDIEFLNNLPLYQRVLGQLLKLMAPLL